MDPIDKVIAALEAHDCNPRKSGNGWEAKWVARNCRVGLEYARRGFAVFPLHGIAPDRSCTCSVTQCKNQGKHPRTPNGLKDATKNLGQIERWWRMLANTNIGIVTGAASGIIVLDVDPRHGGDASLEALIAKCGKLPDTPIVLTGGGGWHYYFKHPGPGVHVPNSSGQLGPGLDVRADGGYVVAPPSLHVSGQLYTWELSSRIDEVPIAPAMDWLLELIRKPGTGQQATRSPSEWVELIRRPIAEGSRNDTLVRLAGHLFRIRVLDPAIAAELVRAVNEARCQPPLAQEEVEAIVESIASRELARSRGDTP
jgi:hypothetical protein